MNMDVPAPKQPVRILRWLPYLAVLQADVDHTLRSWVYRTWVLISFLGPAGYLLYRFGLANEARIIQPASDWISDLLLWMLVESITLIVVLATGAISSERGTMADSVLSRGISRYQYFLGKLHARLLVVMGTFFVQGLIVVAGGFLFLHEDHSFLGCVMAISTIASLLAFVVACSVTVSAMIDTTVVGIALVWMVVYGFGFVMTLIPGRFDIVYSWIHNLPHVIRGHFHLEYQLWLIGGMLLAAGVVSTYGMIHFSKRDV
jgi:ABC-2 type transport system permease protein